MERRTRILLLVLAAVLYFCSMAFGAEVATSETIQCIVSTSEVCNTDDYSHCEQGTAFFSTPENALPIARLKRITQSVSMVKVSTERRNRTLSYVALPSTVAQHYKQHVTSYLHYSYIIYRSLPPEEIAFPFSTFW